MQKATKILFLKSNRHAKKEILPFIPITSIVSPDPSIDIRCMMYCTVFNLEAESLSLDKSKIPKSWDWWVDSKSLILKNLIIAPVYSQ